MKVLTISFATLICVLFLFTSCNKEPDEVTKIETVYVKEVDTLLIRDSATTFILTRHAETTGIGSDPDLSTEGQERVAALVEVLSKLKVAAAYSSSYKRTQQTAAGVAQDHSVSVQGYDPLKPGELIDLVLQDHAYKTVYVAGHSNTVPDLLNVLTGSNDYADIPETEYDNLYLVTVYRKGQATVMHLKYGK
jgi:2,3-bisphosphoglycerate-dependent phosphoglycerate mutase